jgi:hypothetical protein
VSVGEFCRSLLAIALIAALGAPAAAATLDVGVPDHFEAALSEAAAAFVEDAGH